MKLHKCENGWRNLADFLIRSGAKVRKSCRSRQEVSNKYLFSKIGFDTAEDEPLNVCQKLTISQKLVEKKLEVDLEHTKV